MLATASGLSHLPVYNPLEIGWEELPGRCALMTHWHRSEPLPSLLARYDFRVVTLIRHPLDVLLSILHYAPHHPETSRWLGGEHGDERPIVGATPRSRAFLDYATGARASALLSVSCEWSRLPGVLQLRYEDLVGHTSRALSGLIEGLGGRIELPIFDVVERHTLDRMRAKEGVHHWQGRPGLWRELLTPREARRIASAHERLFQDLGYSCDPDEGLRGKDADERWEALAVRRP